MTEKKRKGPGKLYMQRIYQVECALCGNAEHDGAYNYTRQDAVKTFTAWGWQRVRRLGWICPNCVQGTITPGLDANVPQSQL